MTISGWFMNIKHQKQKQICLGQLGFVKQTKTTTNDSDDNSAGAPTNMTAAVFSLCACFLWL